MAQPGFMFDDFSRCESPIEALLQLSMAKSSKRGLLEWCDAENIEELRDCAEKAKWPCVVVGAQIRVDAANARPDFIMAQRRKGAHRGAALLAVECDGEEFHHGDENAVVRDRKRDEKLDALGIAPVRLRGSWIVLDPIKALYACLLRLRDTQPPFCPPGALSASHRRLAAQWSKKRTELADAARIISNKSELASAMAAKREKLCQEVLGR